MRDRSLKYSCGHYSRSFLSKNLFRPFFYPVTSQTNFRAVLPFKPTRLYSVITIFFNFGQTSRELLSLRMNCTFFSRVAWIEMGAQKLLSSTSSLEKVLNKVML
jgi:hypothetical protein